MRIGHHSPFLGRQDMRCPDHIPDLKEEPVNERSHNFDETSTYLATIKIVLYKFVKVLVYKVYILADRGCLLKKRIPDPLSRVNPQRIILKRKVNLTLNRFIKIPDLVSSKEHNSLVIF